MILLVQPLGHRGDPFRRIDGKGVSGAHAIAVGPMGGNAGFGHLVHLAGADLHLDPLAVAARDGGVDRPVAVRFRLADVILEPARHGAPALVDDAQDPVAILFRGADHAEAVDVGQAREGQVLLLHLAPDRVGLLGAAIDIGLDLRLFQFGADIGGDAMHHIAGFALQRDEAADDGIARIGVEHAEGQILQLLAHPLHAHAAGERGEDFHRLAGLLGLLFRLHAFDGAHVVHAVRQLDQNDAQILGHGHEQLAEVFRLLGLGRGQLQVGQLGDAIDQLGHFDPEQARHLGIGRLRVFDGVVQQGRDDGGIVQPLFGQDGGNRNRMREVGLAGLAGLAFVHLQAIGIGPPDQVLIRARIVIADEGDQVFDVDHPRRIPPVSFRLSSVPALP